MNYYERHLGDYAKDAGHLSMLEHGAYTLLLDRYYTTEQPIPADQAHRICRARSRDERAAVDAVLAEFFVLVDGAWTNGRADREITKMQAKVKAAQENGKRGGRPKRTERKPSENPLGSESVTQQKALQTPDTRHQEESASALSARASEPDPEPPTPTPAAAVCIALKAAGVFPVSPVHPMLRTLLDAGATVEEFVAAAAKAEGKRNAFAYVLGVVEGERKRAKDAADELHHGAMPTAQTTTPGESVEAYTARMAAERQAERELMAAQKGPAPELRAQLKALVGGMRAPR